MEVPHSFTADGDGKTMVILGRVQDAEGRVVTGKNDADLVCYPISNELHASGRSLLNWVCEYKVPVDQHPGEESWTRFGDKAELLANVSDFGSWRYQNIVASEMIERTEQVYKFCVSAALTDVSAERSRICRLDSLDWVCTERRSTIAIRCRAGPLTARHCWATPRTRCCPSVSTTVALN
eukprot:COSAG01_NODE_900_length_12865_cov_90.056870_11_plen_180_part_00